MKFVRRPTLTHGSDGTAASSKKLGRREYSVRDPSYGMAGV